MTMYTDVPRCQHVLQHPHICEHTLTSSHCNGIRARAAVPTHLCTQKIHHGSLSTMPR